MHDISGREIIDYIDLMRLVKRACGARALIVPIPYALFRALLRAYALVDRDPPFTTHQLKALVTPDVFAVTDWPEQFSVQPTALADALRETFNDPVYSKIELVF